ncbi:MAG: DUF58 domain-containing protein [Gemmatimonadales bacterium]
MSEAPRSGLLDPAVLARVGDLELVARSAVAGFLHGLHRTPRLGVSGDFAEHRPYQPGDDIRRLDWRVYGRSDRFYVKECQADTNTSVLISLDVSASMSFASGAVTKFQYARLLAAALAWFSQRQGDRIGLTTFAGGVVDFVPCSTRHLRHVLHALERAEPNGKGAPLDGVRAVAERLGRSGIVVLISDWYAAPEALRAELAGLRVRGHEVIALHVMDPAERTFPYDEPAPFEDLESGDRMSVVPASVAARYRERMAAHLESLDRELMGYGIDYTRFETSEPLDVALRAYLVRREAMMRVR